MKNCSKCNTPFPIKHYTKQSKVCQPCKNADQRIRRKANQNSETWKYEKTKNGFLMRLYRNMESRVSGVQKEKFHLYKGKTLLSREEFYDWSINSSSFHSLFSDWEVSKYDRKLTPSVDRINPEQGYETSNMEWVTHSENSSRGSISRHRKDKEAI